MYKAKLVVRVHALKEMCLAFIKTVVISFSSAFLTSFCGMLARTPRGQRLILENGALLSLINRFTARHTKTPLPPTPILIPLISYYHSHSHPSPRPRPQKFRSYTIFYLHIMYEISFVLFRSIPSHPKVYINCWSE